MTDMMELSPEMLLQQSREMLSLRNACESLFEGVSHDLYGINENWSELLSHNFAGKIGSAQKSFMGALQMLSNSASSTMAVAQTMQELDSLWAGKYGGMGADPQVVRSALDKVFGQVKDYVKETEEETNAQIAAMTAWKEKMKGKLTSSQEAWIELIIDKALGDYKDPAKIAEYIANGQYDKALEEFGDVSFEEAAGVLLEKAGYVGTEGAMYGKYGLNLFKDTVEGVTELAMEPSWENVIKLGWKVSGEPVLETANGAIEKVVKLIPGVSEHYYDENGAEEGGDIFNVFMGDVAYAITGDEEERDYYRNAINENGGMVETAIKGVKDLSSFIKDMNENEDLRENFWNGVGIKLDGMGDLLREAHQPMGPVLPINDSIVDDAAMKGAMTAVENAWHAIWDK